MNFTFTDKKKKKKKKNKLHEEQLSVKSNWKLATELLHNKAIRKINT